jgi:ABC-type glycerol-3-phosphate transport system substrate-binding protein
MRRLLSGLALAAALAACGADDRDMQRPATDQTTTTIVRGTSTSSTTTFVPETTTTTSTTTPLP